MNAYQALRVLDGQLPYADFQTAYTPLGYYLHATLFRLFGTSLSVLRASGSFACAATATLLFVAATQVLPGVDRAAEPPLRPPRGSGVARLRRPHDRLPGALRVDALGPLALPGARPRPPPAPRARRRARASSRPAILALKHTAGIYNAWAVGFALVLVARAGDEPPRGPAPFAFLPPAFALAIIAALPVLFGNLTSASLRSFVVFGGPVAVAAAIVLVRNDGSGATDAPPRRHRPRVVGSGAPWSRRSLGRVLRRRRGRTHAPTAAHPRRPARRAELLDRVSAAGDARARRRRRRRGGPRAPALGRPRRDGARARRPGSLRERRAPDGRRPLPRGRRHSAEPADRGLRARGHALRARARQPGLLPRAGDRLRLSPRPRDVRPARRAARPGAPLLDPRRRVSCSSSTRGSTSRTSTRAR